MIFITSNVTNWTELLFLSQKRTGFNVCQFTFKHDALSMVKSLGQWT
jgi:hypothetical protein